MAEQNEKPVEVGEDDTDSPNYKPPASGEPKPEDPRNVIVEKMSFCPEGQPEIEIDITGDLSNLRTFVVKEGTRYRIKIYFYVRREIVTGLRYGQIFTRKGITAGRQTMLVGSYPPKKELQCFTTPMDEAPKGMIARGWYVIKNAFMDDDKNRIMEWQFGMDIKKDWQ